MLCKICQLTVQMLLWSMLGEIALNTGAPEKVVCVVVLAGVTFAALSILLSKS